MKLRKVRAVWLQFESEDGSLSKPRLLLSTDDSLSAEEAFRYYARRWSIEELFNQMKNLGLERIMTAITTGAQSLDSDSLYRLCVATAFSNLLCQRVTATDGVDSVEDQK